LSESTIAGVKVVPLKRIPDERGTILHMLKRTDPHFTAFGEIYFSTVHPGVVKGWHRHKNMTLHYACVSGRVKLVIYDEREGSPTKGKLMEFLMGDLNATCLKIPPGVAHGCRALELSHILYVTSSVYAPDDEGRIPHDDPTIGYDWTAGPTIK
jgi:dTDP-4-dehydrorhamnose 3,5-epimerase